MTTQAPVVVGILGRGVVAPDSLVVAADDLGLTRGDGCFDATLVRVTGGRPVVNLLEGHLARFERSAARLDLTVDRAAWQGLIDDVLAAYPAPDGSEATLKLMLTGGRESADPAQQVGLAMIIPVGPGLATSRQGVTAVSLPKNVSSAGFADAPWLLGSVKTLSYALNRAAYREANRRGADEAIWTSIEGHVLEAPTSTVILRRDDTLITPDPAPTGVLGSVTQEAIWAGAASLGLSPEFGLFTPEDLRSGDGVWLVSAVRGVVPLLTQDGQPVSQDPNTTAALRRLAGF